MDHRDAPVLVEVTRYVYYMAYKVQCKYVPI